MTEFKGNNESSQPWYKRRASAHRAPARNVLFLSSFAFILLSFALFIAADVTVPATLELSLFYVENRYISFNGDNPVLELGTFGYCVNWLSNDVDATISATQSPICFHGNGYNMATIVTRFFGEQIPLGYISNITPAVAVLHSLITVLTLLVLVTAALPCFVPPIFAVVLSWITSSVSVAAVGCAFSLAMAIRSRSFDHSGYVFGYGVGIWTLLVGAISAWLYTAFLTTAWWLRRRLERKSSDEFNDHPASVNGLSGFEVQPGELPSQAAPGELSEGKESHRHELSNTAVRYKGRVEAGSEERYELGIAERSNMPPPTTIDV